jgi:hypothetical protein
MVFNASLLLLWQGSHAFDHGPPTAKIVLGANSSESQCCIKCRIKAIVGCRFRDAYILRIA